MMLQCECEQPTALSIVEICCHLRQHLGNVNRQLAYPLMLPRLFSQMHREELDGPDLVICMLVNQNIFNAMTSILSVHINIYQ